MKCYKNTYREKGKEEKLVIRDKNSEIVMRNNKANNNFIKNNRKKFSKNT